MVWSKPPDHARAFGHPVPHSGSLTRRHAALPSSRVTPVEACPALRPRGCPECSPLRLQDCGLPATGNRRRFPPYGREDSPAVHNCYPFRGSITWPASSLHPAPHPSLQRRTRVRYCPAGEAFVRWDLNRFRFAPTGQLQPISWDCSHSYDFGLTLARPVSGSVGALQRVSRPASSCTMASVTATGSTSI